MLELSEARLDVIGMYDIIGIGDMEVICMDEDVVTHRVKLAVEFQTIGH